MIFCFVLLLDFCLFVCLGIIVPFDNFSLIWRCHHYRWKAGTFELCSTFIAIEQWGFCRVPHLPWHGVSAIIWLKYCRYILNHYPIIYSHAYSSSKSSETVLRSKGVVILDTEQDFMSHLTNIKIIYKYITRWPTFLHNM